jgi:hypothetical protein
LASCAADEGVRRDGKRLTGSLALTADGRLRFTPATGDPLPAADFLGVRFTSPSCPPFRAAAGWRFLLPGGQSITGELLGMDGEAVRLRTAWAPRLELPRTAVTAVSALPGWRLRFADDFSDGLVDWTLAGKPSPQAGDPPAVVLDAAGQGLTHKLSEPLTAGRLGVNFEDRQSPKGARWELEADFQKEGKPRTVRVTVAGAKESYGVEVPGIAGEPQAVARSAGWHRLVVQFTADSLRITCDDSVLWYCLKAGPGGPLRQVRLTCRAEGTGATRGAVAWSAFSIEQRVVELSRPDGDAGQDEVSLHDGDQLFGKILRADPRAIDFKGRFGARSLPWTQVRSVYLRRATPPPTTTTGAHVRLALTSGLAPDADTLEGVVKSLDDRVLVLRNTLLGEVRLDRAFVKEVRPLFHGRRMELDLGFHHLGEADRLAPGLDPPRAEGPAWRGTFPLDVVPDEARLVLDVMQLLGPRDPAGKSLAEGGPRTEVVVNGTKVDYLNRQVERMSRTPRRLGVALPRGALRSGENVIELRQSPDPRTGRPAHCGVANLIVEIPE